MEEGCRDGSTPCSPELIWGEAVVPALSTVHGAAARPLPTTMGTRVLCLHDVGALAGRSRGSQGAWHLFSCEHSSMQR